MRFARFFEAIVLLSLAVGCGSDPTDESVGCLETECLAAFTDCAVGYRAEPNYGFCAERLGVEAIEYVPGYCASACSILDDARRLSCFSTRAPECAAARRPGADPSAIGQIRAECGASIEGVADAECAADCGAERNRCEEQCGRGGTVADCLDCSSGCGIREATCLLGCAS